MFTRQLRNGDASKATKIVDPAAPHYRMGDYGFGKRSVRVFQLKKNGPVHSIVEFIVSSHMRLTTHKEYYEADNSDIVGSDVQESNIYLHAQRHGLSTPEEYALTLTKHFLDTYEQAMSSNVIVEEVGWSRLGEHEKQGYYKNKAHNHAFTMDSNGRRFCEVVRQRNEKEPLLLGGLRGLRVLKTAQAPFTGYVKGSLYTEGDMPDRILCVDIDAKWQYGQTENIDFTTHWAKVRDLILRTFAGDPVQGVTVTSVQYVAYAAERAILDAMPEICSVSISLPNYKNFPFDFSRFPPLDQKADIIICNPSDLPLGIGYAQLDRRQIPDESIKEIVLFESEASKDSLWHICADVIIAKHGGLKTQRNRSPVSTPEANSNRRYKKLLN